MRGARLGGPAAHVQKSLARPSAALSTFKVRRQNHSSLICGFKKRHELVAGLAGRRDGLAGRRGDLAGPRKVAGEEEAAAEGHINVVKSKGRSTLGDVNFDNAVFNTFNMPPLHHVDYGAFVRAWKQKRSIMGHDGAFLRLSPIIR